MRTDPLRLALERSSFFQGIGLEELRLLQAMMRPRRLEADELLFEQGEQGDAMALVSHGRLEVRVRGHRGSEDSLQSMEPGDVVGEMACVDPAPRSATVLAREPSLVHLLDRQVLAYLRREAPGAVAAVVGSVIAQLTQRLRATNDRIEAELLRLAGGEERPSPLPPRLDPGPPPQRHRGQLHLVDLAPLQGLEQRDLERLSSVAPTRVWQDRAVLCHEGDHGASCFLLVAGEVDVVKTMRGKRRRLATLSQGALAGQAALVDRSPRSASLRARGTVVAFELDRGSFERLLAQAHPLALRFQEEIAVSGIRQLRSANARLVQLLGKQPGASASPPPPRPARGPDRRIDTVRAALSEWGVLVEDLDEVELVKPDGLASAAETAARRRQG
jgi:CRP/FNR family cyclic AMP-dependent transcriptional regulator